MQPTEELQTLNTKIKYLLNLLNEDMLDNREVNDIQTKLNVLCNELLILLEQQYLRIKAVSLGHHDDFKKEIETLFEINKLLESVLFIDE